MCANIPKQGPLNKSVEFYEFAFFGYHQYILMIKITLIDQHENHDNNGHFDNHDKNHQEGRLPLHYAATREELKPIYTALVNKGECLD